MSINIDLWPIERKGTGMSSRNYWMPEAIQNSSVVKVSRAGVYWYVLAGMALAVAIIYATNVLNPMVQQISSVYGRIEDRYMRRIS